MLSKHISIDVIEQIFKKDANKHLGDAAKIFYIEALLKHFVNLPVSINNLGTFQVDYSLMDSSSWLRSKRLLDELIDSNLVMRIANSSVSRRSYIYSNVWSKYMDISKLQADSVSLIDVKSIESSLLSYQSFIELAAYKNKLSIVNIKDLIRLFSKEQEVLERKYPNMQEVKVHFLNYIKFNKDQIQETKSVKTTAKILGDDRKGQ